MIARALIIGHPSTAHENWGAEIAPDFAEARQKLSERSYSVVIYSRSKDAHAKDIAQYIQNQCPESIHVLVIDKMTTEELLETLSCVSPFRIIDSFEQKNFSAEIQDAFTAYDQSRQELELLQMKTQQAQSLKAMTLELETRVAKRQADLRASAQRLNQANTHAQLLHTCLVNIYRARTIGEMESLLNRVLTQNFGLQWVRIILAGRSNVTPTLQTTPQINIHTVSLAHGPNVIGTIYFAKASSRSFLKNEKLFLTQIADAVLLAIGRLSKLDQIENLKRQWEATFDAISVPLCLTNSSLKIIKTNQAYAIAVGKEFRDLPGVHALETFFDPTVLPSNLREGTHRLLRTREGQAHTYDVHIHPLGARESNKELWLCLFADMTSQIELERHVVESSKMAEIGTIGSSIAHELNNPLAGMLSFTQLAKMNSPPQDALTADLNQMEAAVRKCRDIVQSLLGFSRRHRDDELTKVNLNDVVEQAVKITSLVARSKGIAIRVTNQTKSPPQLNGRFNQLVQALCNILQNSVDAISVRMLANPRFEGLITITLVEDEKSFQLEITDNGIGIAENIKTRIFDPLFTTKSSQANTGLGLTVAYKILADHFGQVEISSHEGQGTTAKISLQRLDLSS